MFRDATNFNQPLDTWDVSKVTNMYQMFVSATKFNPDFARTTDLGLGLLEEEEEEEGQNSRVKIVGDIDNSKTKRSFCNIS